MSFPPSAACKFLDLHPVNLRNLHLHLTKNPFASRQPHLRGVTLKTFFCLIRFENTSFNAFFTPDTFAKVNFRIQESFFVWNHSNCISRTYTIAGRTATALILFYIQNHFFLHNSPFTLLFSFYSTPNH